MCNVQVRPYLTLGAGAGGRWAGAVGGVRSTGKVQSGQKACREDGKVSPVKEGKAFRIVPVFHAYLKVP